MSSSGLVRGGAGVPSGPVRRRFLSEEGKLHSSYQGAVTPAERGPAGLSELPPRMLCNSSDRSNDGRKTASLTSFHATWRWAGPGRPIKLTSSSPTPQIQPLDTALLSAAKSRTDAYHPVVSTSPVLYLTHPSAQALRRPLTLTLPCPPNPQKKKNHGGRQEESGKDQTQKDKAGSQGR